MKKYYLILNCLLFLLFFPNGLNAQGITLVDFGDSQESTTFGLAGWNNILQSENMQFTVEGKGGLVVNGECEEFDDFRGISGTARDFSLGERIAVTWYNHSDETIFFTARISFTDSDHPNPEQPDKKWYTMRRFDDYRFTYTEALAHDSTKTVFNITDTGVHKTDGSFSLVNLNLAIEWGSTYQKPFLICEKIELLNDADITPPQATGGPFDPHVTDSQIEFGWFWSSGEFVIENLIYMDGEIEGYSRGSTFTSVFLEPNKEYNFWTTSLDAVGNESEPSDSVRIKTLTFKGEDNLINPAGFEYLGAIALPEDFNWGGEAIAHYNGDGSASMFVSNVNQPQNGLIGRVSLPEPVISAHKNIAELNHAETLQQPVDIRPANVNNWDYVDIWRTGLEYLPDENRLYSSWSIHYTVSEEKHASISCCDAADLAGSTKYGAWYIGSANEPPLDAAMSDWLFSVPQAWADAHCDGQNLMVGRCRDGGLSGLGPTLYAFSPLGESPPAPDSELSFTTLLEYGSVAGTDNYNYPNSIDGYKHSDDWRGAMWLTASRQHAIAVIGNKALGHNWYGYHGERMHHEWVIADVPYPEFYETDPDGKGWRAHNMQPIIIFYNPDDLARVIKGEFESWEPQPYAALRIPKELFFGKNHEIFSAAFDSQTSTLYITEFIRELEGQLLLHVWKVNPSMVNVEDNAPAHTFTLAQNYPNPFNPLTSIHYFVAKPTVVSIDIYNITGERVACLQNKFHPAGSYQTTWAATDFSGKPVASGIYFYNMRADHFSVTRRMLLLR